MQLSLVLPAHDNHTITVAEQYRLADVKHGVTIEPEARDKRTTRQEGRGYPYPRHDAYA